jgi:glycosyltransferase involved in cell wall biosynthesis
VDGETGWVFSSGNGAALARALAALGDDAAVRAAGQAAYRRFWAAPPDRARHTRQLLDIYRTVLARAEVG